jgi:hypothetical protein
MLIEVQFDLLVHFGFEAGDWPLSLIDEIGFHKQDLYRSARPNPLDRRIRSGEAVLAAEGSRFRVFYEIGEVYEGEGREQIALLYVQRIEEA